MGPHEEFLELCAAATAGELSAEEQGKLEVHLRNCFECRQAMKDYDSLATKGLPMFSAELANAGESIDESWSMAGAEKRLFKRLDDERQSDSGSVPNEKSPAIAGQRYTYRPSQIRWKEVWMPFAAAVLLAVALGVTLYKTGLRRGIDSARVVSAPSGMVASKPDVKPPQVERDREQLETKLAEKDKLIEQLQRQLSEQVKTVSILQAANLPASNTVKSPAPSPGETGRSNSVELAAAQVKLAELQKALDAATSERNEVSSRAVALQEKLTELSQLDKQRERALDERDSQIANLQELLEHDRDIRDLMGARDLYMADVHDVSGKGTEKTYGRVFYTKGKSLIFYAFDLDARPGVRNASSFQAWGRRGPDKQQARSLGIFFEDNASKKRWVLKADDPKSLQDIDAVFVTLEPNGGSQHPSGKQLLFAWLRVDANHP